MITIQGFARLCGCNTQTLRYYDRIGLLAPAKVDPWTGYRYYEEEQAMRFVKIKNLQQADFSIEEIRPLLEESDERLLEAFERKIQAQKQKLERIRKIQRSYLKETMDMQKAVHLINSFVEFVEGRADDPRLWNELGLDGAQETESRAKVHEVLAGWLAQCKDTSGEIARSVGKEELGVMENVLDSLVSGKEKGVTLSVAAEDNGLEKDIPADARMEFERSGWEHVSEWIGDLPDLSDGKQNFFLFRVREGSPVSDPGFPTLALALMASRYGAMNGGMFCNVGRSSDGLNHFTLYRK